MTTLGNVPHALVPAAGLSVCVLLRRSTAGSACAYLQSSRSVATGRALCHRLVTAGFVGGHRLLRSIRGGGASFHRAPGAGRADTTHAARIAIGTVLFAGRVTLAPLFSAPSTVPATPKNEKAAKRCNRLAARRS